MSEKAIVYKVSEEMKKQSIESLKVSKEISMPILYLELKDNLRLTEMLVMNLCR